MSKYDKQRSKDVRGKDKQNLSVFASSYLTSSSGFTLIELVIYLAIFSMIAVTLVSLAYFSSMENQKTTNDVINAYENND